jgi:hypothetical protein
MSRKKSPLSKFVVQLFRLLGSFAMEENEIAQLFRKIADASAADYQESREVFTSLVKSTLRYRDVLKQSRDTVLTVQDVRITLDWLLPAFTTGRLPKTDNKIRLDLLKIWLDELKILGHRPAPIQ